MAEDATEAAVREKTTAEKTLSKLRETQAALVESEKLASLGSLVASVAHEMNTPLGVILTANSSAQDNLAQLAQHVEDGTLTKAKFKEQLTNSRDGIHLALDGTRKASEIINKFKKIAVDQVSESERTFWLGTTPVYHCG